MRAGPDFEEAFGALCRARCCYFDGEHFARLMGNAVDSAFAQAEKHPPLTRR